MKTATQNAITVESTILAPDEQVWKYWTQPEHIQNWCAASDDWHAPYAENDIRLNGKFKTTMAAKDGSFSFDFEGIYTNVEDLKKIDYQMGDGRNVEVEFVDKGESTQVI